MFGTLAIVVLLMELRLTRRARITLLAIAYAILVVIVGLRWETGNDWPNYYNYYHHLQSLNDNSDEFEVGYRFVSLAVKDSGLPFSGFNLLYAAAYLGLFFLSFKRDNFDVSGWLVLQLFSPFLFGLMGTMRQVMAIAICMFSVRYLLSREWFKFLLCVAAATAFHISALAFLLAWPAARFKLSKTRIWLMFGFLFLASSFHLGEKVFQMAEERISVLQLVDLENRLLIESESRPEQFNVAIGPVATIVQMAGRLALLLVFTLFYDLYDEVEDKTYFKLYLVSIFIVVLFSGSLYVLAQRVALYFSLFQIHLLALLTRRASTRTLRQLSCAALLLLSFLRLWSAAYFIRPRIFVPYKAVFMNQDVKRDAGWF